jgi:hypothetical protein
MFSNFIVTKPESSTQFMLKSVVGFGSEPVLSTYHPQNLFPKFHLILTSLFFTAIKTYVFQELLQQSSVCILSHVSSVANSSAVLVTLSDLYKSRNSSLCNILLYDQIMIALGRWGAVVLVRASTWLLMGSAERKTYAMQ